MKEIKVNIHSFVDVITNSSTEIFVTVKNNTKKQIEDILKEILKEFGCTSVEFDVINTNSYDKDTNEEKEIENSFDVLYDYECHCPPCKKILERITEIFGVDNIEEYDY
jgi:hypothetical protein